MAPHQQGHLQAHLAGHLPQPPQQPDQLHFRREDNRKGGRIGVGADAQESRQWRRLFNGLIWESLLSDNQVLRSQVGATYYGEHLFPSLCGDDPADCDHLAPVRQTFPLQLDAVNNERHVRNDTIDVQFANRYDYFLETRKAGEHALSLRSTFFTEQETDRNSTPGDTYTLLNGNVPVRRTTYYANDPRLEPERFGWFIQGVSWYRHVLTVSDSWRATRYLTVGAGASHIWARAGNTRRGAGMDTQAFAPSLSVAWDAGHDGRTVLRGSASSYADVDIEAIARHQLAARVSQACDWNPATELFDRNCIYDGGASRNTIGLPCGPTGYDLQGRPCREALRIPRTRELVLGAEREVVPGLAMSLDGIYRKFAQQYDIRETNLVWNGSGTLLMPTAVSATARPERRRPGPRRLRPAPLPRRHPRRAQARGPACGSRARTPCSLVGGASDDFGDVPARIRYLSGYCATTTATRSRRWRSTSSAAGSRAGLRYFWRSGVPYNRFYRNVGLRHLRRQPRPDRLLARHQRQRPWRRTPAAPARPAELQPAVRFNLQPLIHKRLDLFVDILKRARPAHGGRGHRERRPHFGLPPTASHPSTSAWRQLPLLTPRPQQPDQRTAGSLASRGRSAAAGGAGICWCASAAAGERDLLVCLGGGGGRGSAVCLGGGGGGGAPLLGRSRRTGGVCSSAGREKVPSRAEDCCARVLSARG
jgi:hypothetical protein